MKKHLAFVAFVLAWAGIAGAQERVISIATLGLADLQRPSEVGPSGGGRYGGIRIADTISVGDVIPIQYQRDSGMVSDSFMVTGILVEGNRCTLESKNNLVPGALPEKIHVGCRVLR